MEMGFEVEGIWAVVVMVIMVVLPIKAGAHMVSAKNTNFGACVIASIVGVFSAILVSALVPSEFGASIAGFLGFLLSIRYVLGTTFIGSIVLSIVAVGVALLAGVVLSGVF